MGSMITVHKVQPGEAKVGRDPRGVQIFYKEDTNVQGNRNLAYLSDLLQKHGFQVKEGDRLSDTPMRYLHFPRKPIGEQTHADEISPPHLRGRKLPQPGSVR